MNLCILKSWGKKLLEDLGPVIGIALTIQAIASITAWVTIVMNIIFFCEDIPKIVYIFSWIGVAEVAGFICLWIAVRYEEAKNDCEWEVKRNSNKRS